MATLTATSASQADVQAKISAAARGDTVVVPAGSVTWSGTIALNRGVVVQGAGRDSLTVKNGGPSFSIVPDATAVAGDETIKVTGFTFDGNNTALVLLQIAGAWNGLKFRNLVIGDCRFRNTGGATSGAGAISIVNGQVRGVIYNNIFDRCSVVLKAMADSNLGTWKSGKYPIAYGNDDNLFFENNSILFSSAFSGGEPGWLEVGQSSRVCVRYNSYDYRNADHGEVWDVHGMQNWTPVGQGNGQAGTMIAEFYGNTVNNANGYNVMNHRGSWLMMHNNIFNSSTGAAWVSQYPEGCDAVTGVPGGQVNNSYFFNNSLNGGALGVNLNVGGCGVLPNKGYWVEIDSFNGTAGVGKGTAAPSGNCTQGVGYWQNASPGPTVDPAVVQKGTFWKAASANTWISYYKPYAFPHPLRSGTPPPVIPPVIPLMPGLTFEAEAGLIDAPYSVANGLVSQAVVTTNPADGGRAQWRVTVPSAGDYTVKAKVKAVDNGSDSLFMTFDAEPTTADQWTVAPLTSGVEERGNPRVWTLSAGEHVLCVRGREMDCALDSITIVPPVPPEPPKPTNTVIKGTVTEVDGVAATGTVVVEINK